MKTSLLLLAIGLLAAGPAVAADCYEASDSCDSSGSGIRCKKGCRIVCEMKKVKKTCWVVECEEFCAPLPGFGWFCGRSCGDYGDDSSDCGSCCDSFRKLMTTPKCGKVRCRKKLVKKTITYEVPVYKCVPVCDDGYCDPCCEEAGETETPEPALAAPPAPVAKAPLPPVR